MFPLTYLIVICQKISSFAYINIYTKQIIIRQWQQEISNTTNTSLCKEKKILDLQRIRPFPMQEPNPAEPANHTL